MTRQDSILQMPSTCIYNRVSTIAVDAVPLLALETIKPFKVRESLLSRFIFSLAK